MRACPSESWTKRKSAPASNKCVAIECLRQCGCHKFSGNPASFPYFCISLKIQKKLRARSFDLFSMEIPGSGNPCFFFFCCVRKLPKKVLIGKYLRFWNSTPDTKLIMDRKIKDIVDLFWMIQKIFLFILTIFTSPQLIIEEWQGLQHDGPRSWRRHCLQSSLNCSLTAIIRTPVIKGRNGPS